MNPNDSKLIIQKMIINIVADEFTAWLDIMKFSLIPTFPAKKGVVVNFISSPKDMRGEKSKPVYLYW